MEIVLTPEEKKRLEDHLFFKLDTISEYHPRVRPNESDSLSDLMDKYFYWGEEYNDSYIPEENIAVATNSKLAKYLVQGFKEYIGDF